MSCLSVNSRGLGNRVVVRELRNLVKQEAPLLLFVMETKINSKRTEKLCNALGFSSSFAVSSVRLSGGIGLFWNSEITVDLKSFNSNHIDVLVQPRDGGAQWRFTGFYGEPRREN
jgi:hypothetical protein